MLLLLLDPGLDGLELLFDDYWRQVLFRKFLDREDFLADLAFRPPSLGERRRVSEREIINVDEKPLGVFDWV